MTPPAPVHHAPAAPASLSVAAADDGFSRDLVAAAAARGLGVTQADGSLRPIAIGAVPVVLDEVEIQARARLASRLLSATALAAAWRLARSDRGEDVLDALGPAERRMVVATAAHPPELAVARVDFLVDARLQALEVNCTIPAMQGYSDIAAEAWIETRAAGREDSAALIAANGSNAEALLRSLRQRFRRHRGLELESLGLLCRRGDAQLSELRYLVERFGRAGLDARIVHPDQLHGRDGLLSVDARPLQMVYRHIFLSRLDATPCPALEAALAAGPGSKGTLVLNPPAPHWEMKSTLAVLSEALEAPALARSIGLDEATLAAIRDAVPWTRRLLALDAASFARVQAEPDAHVLKRSWSYGGHDVFIGSARESEAFTRRLHAFDPRARDWATLCSIAREDRGGGGFVVQRSVRAARSMQRLCLPDAAPWAEVTTDYAAFASLGDAPGWSGVCRASSADVVNIVAGGAVVPLLRASVARRLGLVAAEARTGSSA